MRWHDLIEHPAKGKAVIARRGEQGVQVLTERWCACVHILCVRWSKSLKVSPCIPFAPREVEQTDRSFSAFSSKPWHSHFTFARLARETIPSSLHPHLSSWLLFLQQAQMAAQMVIWGLSVSLGKMSLSRCKSQLKEPQCEQDLVKHLQSWC